IARSCSTDGMTTDGRLETLDIVSHLASVGRAQADDPSHLATIYKRHVVEDLGLRRERDHAQLVVLEAGVEPNQRSFPVEFRCQSQRDTMLRKVRFVFRRIELDSHALL